jgi:hypothetical protein
MEKGDLVRPLLRKNQSIGIITRAWRFPHPKLETLYDVWIHDSCMAINVYLESQLEKVNASR